MKITIQNTSQIVQVEGPNGASIPGRVWEGITDSGIFVQCVITRIAASKFDDLSQFDRELQECDPPRATNVFSLRMVL